VIRTAALAPGLAAALAAVLAALAALPASARTTRLAPPPSSALWLDVRTGLVFEDTVEFQRPDDFEPTRPEVSDETTLGLGVGLHWRARRFDLGAFVEGFGSGRFNRLATTARIGSQVRIAGTFRWRFIEEHWGGLYLRFSPGLGIYELSDPMRFEVSKLTPAGDFQEVDETALGFSFGFDLGLHFYVSRRVGLYFELGTVTGQADLVEGPDQVALTRVRGLLVAGVEWAPSP
jgi:hypothetical protein